MMKPRDELLLWVAAIGVILLLSWAFGCSAARAHDAWSNGEPVPPWTKSWCCGPADVHRIAPGAVHVRPDGYHVDGLATVFPFSKALPSADGDYWGFWKDSDGPNAHVYCFYAPLNGF